MEVIILILLVIIGTWVGVEDFKNRRVTSILSYSFLALILFYMYRVNYYYGVFIAIFILTILITQFGKEYPNVNYLDIFYIIFTCLILKYCVKEGISFISILPIMIGGGLIFLLKEKEKIPMIGICNIIIILSLLINYI